MESDRLFARLYLDEDVHVRIARIVRGHGFSVRTTRGENMLGATDAEQLAFAADQSHVVVTHNRTDFEELARQYYEEGRSHAGIICAVRRPPRDCATRLLALLNDRTASEFENHLLYV
jgi:predicted nuclease of predicted toxin-antitoxin system